MHLPSKNFSRYYHKVHLKTKSYKNSRMFFSTTLNNEICFGFNNYPLFR